MLLACAYSWGIPVLLSCATAIVQFANPSFMSVPGDSDGDDHSDDNSDDNDGNGSYNDGDIS